MPVQTTTVASGSGAMAVTLAGSVLGIQYDALTLALLGGMVAMMHLPPRGKLGSLLSIAASSVFGGVLALPATMITIHYMAWADESGQLPLRMSIAFLLGMVTHVAIPVVFGLLRRKGETL